MANKLRNEMDIELGGKSYTMRATWEFVANIEAALGNIFALMASPHGLTARQTAEIIFHGLKGGGVDTFANVDEVGRELFNMGMARASGLAMDFVVLAWTGVSLGKPEGAES
jgi:hypothetical protein